MSFLDKLMFWRGDPKKPHVLLQRLRKRRFPLDTVIHVGAHTAHERWRYERLGFKNILWVEGSPSTFAGMSRSLAEDRARGKLRARHVAVNALITDKPGERRTLYGFSNGGAANSIFAGTETMATALPGLTRTGVDEPMVSTTLDQVAAETGFTAPDLLVVDVQGAELLVFMGGRTTTAAANAIICEVSLESHYVGGVLYDELRDFLAAQGFVPMQAASVHCDVLFLRQEYA